MDITVFRSNFPLLVQYMKANHYNSKYIRFIQTEINWILSNFNENWSSLEDACQERLSQLKNGTRPSARSIFTLLNRFIVTGQFPDGKKHASIINKSSYHQLLSFGQFKHVIDTYIRIVSNRKTVKTIISEVSSTAAFFLAFEKQEIYSLAEIDEDHVLNYFKSQNRKTGHGYGSKNQISIVLKACGENDISDCLRINSYLPKLKNRRKNIQYLDDDEIDKLKKVLYDTETQLSYRDRAIILLLLFTGIRAIDIAKMQVSSIDWERSSIHIIQDKTDQPVEIPLNAITGNMIYDYLMKERPESNSKYLFLSQSVHHKEHLTSAGIADIVDRVFKVANIRGASGDRRGTHLFRHNLASSLLERDIPKAIITSTLVHTSPMSLEPYIRADFKHLKECGLSIEQFSVREGVFSS